MNRDKLIAFLTAQSTIETKPMSEAAQFSAVLAKFGDYRPQVIDLLMAMGHGDKLQGVSSEFRPVKLFAVLTVTGNSNANNYPIGLPMLVTYLHDGAPTKAVRGVRMDGTGGNNLKLHDTRNPTAEEIAALADMIVASSGSGYMSEDDLVAKTKEFVPLSAPTEEQKRWRTALAGFGCKGPAVRELLGLLGHSVLEIEGSTKAKFVVGSVVVCTDRDAAPDHDCPLHKPLYVRDLDDDGDAHVVKMTNSGWEYVSCLRCRSEGVRAGTPSEIKTIAKHIKMHGAPDGENCAWAKELEKQVSAFRG